MMLPTLQQAIERITTLAEQLDPAEQAFAAEQLRLLAEQLEHDRQWDELLASPESQAYLLARGRAVMRELEAGEMEEGGWGA